MDGGRDVRVCGVWRRGVSDCASPVGAAVDLWGGFFVGIWGSLLVGEQGGRRIIREIDLSQGT